MTDGLRIVPNKTTLSDVKAYLDQHAQNDSKVLAKKVDKVTVLYIGKAKSNPFERLFGIADQRKQLAKTTLENLADKANKTAQKNPQYSASAKKALTQCNNDFQAQITAVPKNKAVRAGLV